MKSLLSLQQIEREGIESLLSRAQTFSDHGYQQRVQGTVVNLFYEASTRTSLSFQIAAERLGMHVLDFEIGNSSVQKGESFLDTLETLDALGVDLAVVRKSGDWPNSIGAPSLGIS